MDKGDPMWDTPAAKAFRAELEGNGKGKGKKKAKGVREAKGGKGPPARAWDDIPRMMCKSFSAQGSCPRSQEGWHCPYNHYTPDQVVMEGSGYWRPMPGMHSREDPAQPAARLTPARAATPQVGLGTGATEPGVDEWDWETSSQSSGRSGRSAGSSKATVQHARSLLAGALAMINPAPPCRPPLHAVLANLAPDPSRITTGGLTDNSRPC